MKQMSLFVSVILIITVGYVKFFYAVKEYYNGTGDLKRRIAKLERSVEVEKFKMTLVNHEYYQFRNYVASILPDSIPQNMTPQNQQLRNIASIVRSEETPKHIDLSKVLLDDAKEHFRKKEYPSTIKVLNRIITEYPVNENTVELRFLLAESYFLANDLDDSLIVINEMLSQFPENELTGFIMLRMGQIFEVRHRPQDAAEVYRTIIRTFPSMELKKQAKTLLDKLET